MQGMKNPGIFFRVAPLLAALVFFPLTLAAEDNRVALTGTGLRITTTQATDGSKTSPMTVDTDVPKTEVYLDGIYEGLTPIRLANVVPGIRQLTLKKDGYYTGQYTIEIRAGETKEVYAELVRATGFLSVKGVPESAKIEVDGVAQRGLIVELAEGSHEVTVRAFGYLEKKSDIRITRKSETELVVTLERAPFSVTDFKSKKRAFNPDNPENIGTVGITFTVSAPGSATLTVLNASGSPVRVIRLPSFETWKQTMRWDGRDENGNALADGEYTLSLDARPASETPGGQALSDTRLATEAAFRATVKIDRNIVYPNTAPWVGVGATGPVVSGTLMPEGTVLVCTDTLFERDRFNPALSALAGVTDWLEAGIRAGVSTGNGDNAGITVAAGVKAGLNAEQAARFAEGRLRPAFALRYETDLGIAGGPALEYRMGAFAAGINAEIAYGDEDGFFNDPALSASTGIALRYTVKAFSFAAWGKTGTARDGRDFGTPLESGAGLAVQWIIPKTSLVISGDGGCYFIPDGENQPFARFGFGFVF